MGRHRTTGERLAYEDEALCGMNKKRNGNFTTRERAALRHMGILHMHKISMARALVTNTQVQEVDMCPFDLARDVLHRHVLDIEG